MRRMTFLLKAAAIAWALVALVSSAAVAGATPTTVARECGPLRVKTLVSNAPFTLQPANTYTALPRTAVNFTQGGANANCVIVHFTVQLNLGSNGEIRVRAVLDGNPPLGPPEWIMNRESGDQGFGPRSFTFLFPSVAPGAHQVRIQYLENTAFTVSGTLGPYVTSVHFIP